MTKEQEEAKEYLKKYTKWETYGERNLEKDIITILNLVDKLQEENEELKEDRKNNNEMIAFAQNEMLNYMSGYEDGKKHKMTAVAQVVENQQYYIVREQMEKYKELIKRLQKENEELIEKYKLEKLKNSEIEELLENSISKDIIQELISERKFLLQQNYEDFENDIELKTLIKVLGEEK